MKTVFLDANVLYSAARKADGEPWKLFQTRRARWMSSGYALEEARRNLPAEHRPALAELARKLVLVADAIAPPPAGVKLPAKDVPILATVALAGADFLAAGDAEHFGRYYGRTVGGVKIVRPVDLLTVL